MDIGLIRGILTVVLFVAFCGLCLWAWSSRRKADFEQAARLPLDDEAPRDQAVDNRGGPGSC